MKADLTSLPNLLHIEEDDLSRAQFVGMAIRGLSDLLTNMQLKEDMQMVKPENLEALLTILADQLEQALNI